MGPQIVVQMGDKIRVRNKAKLKLIWDQPACIIPQSGKGNIASDKICTEDDEDGYSLSKVEQQDHEVNQEHIAVNWQDVWKFFEAQGETAESDLPHESFCQQGK